MITSKIDRETYKRNKIKELMSLETDSDNEWFEENNLVIQHENKNENASLTHENKSSEGQHDLMSDIDNFDFNDSLSSRLDAFQEKINAMLAEGNKMLNQSITRKNVDLPSSTYDNDRIKRHRHNSHSKPKVAFSNDDFDLSIEDHSDPLLSSENNHSDKSMSFINSQTMKFNTINNKTTQTEQSSPNKKKDNQGNKKSSFSDSNRKLDGKNMLQDAISFSKFVLNNNKTQISKLNNKKGLTTNSNTVQEESSDLNHRHSNNDSNSPYKHDNTNNDNDNSNNGNNSNNDNSDNESNNDDDNDNNDMDSNNKNKNKNKMSSKNNIDILLSKSFHDGESILKNNELELLRIEIKELKEKNKQLEQENINLKIRNSSLMEKQIQQEQQIELLKQKNSQIPNHTIPDINVNSLGDTSYVNSVVSTPLSSYPSSPYMDNNSQDMDLLSPSTDLDGNNHDHNNNSIRSPSSKITNPNNSNTKLNTLRKNGIINSTLIYNKINRNNNLSVDDASSYQPSDNSFEEDKTISSVKSLTNIKNMDNRRFSFPQRLNTTNLEDLESQLKHLSYSNKNNLSNRNRSNSNTLFYQPSSQKNRSLLRSNNYKRHSMFADIKSYNKIIEGWKQMENTKKENTQYNNTRKDTINYHDTIDSNDNNPINNNNHRNNNKNKINNNTIEDIKADLLNNTNIGYHTINTLNSKRYSLVYPSSTNNDKTKRYSYLSDISPLGEIKYDVNSYIDKLNSPTVANNKNRVRKISESYANDLRHRENILKNCSLSPPKFKYSDMKDIDLMTEYKESMSSPTIDSKENKAIKRKSILDQISYIRIDHESINNIKNEVHHHSRMNSVSSFKNTTPDIINQGNPKDSLPPNAHIDSNNDSSPSDRRLDDHSSVTDRQGLMNHEGKVEIKHLNHRLSLFKSQIQNVQKDLSDMLECEKRIQDLLIPINNSETNKISNY